LGPTPKLARDAAGNFANLAPFYARRRGPLQESDKMTKEQAIEKLRELQKSEDEQAYEQATTVLCEFLISLGYADVVEEYDKL
jgi:hypothetical protein